MYTAVNSGTASTVNDGLGAVDCDSRRAVGSAKTIRGVYMTHLLSVLSGYFQPFVSGPSMCNHKSTAPAPSFGSPVVTGTSRTPYPGVHSSTGEYSCQCHGTASTGNDGGTKRRGFRSKIVITHRRTTHEGLKVPPNAPDGLVVSYISLV